MCGTPRLAEIFGLLRRDIDEFLLLLLVQEIGRVEGE
jgi:hypothetical protein